MIRDAIEKILNMARPEVVEIDDRQYLLQGRDPAVEIFPDPLQVYNLSGVIDYCCEDPEEFENFVLHVADYNKVVLYKSMDGPFNQRPVLVKSVSRDCGFKFGLSYNYEEFMVAIYTSFAPNDDRDYILKFISGVRVDTGSKVEDNGITQVLTAKTGASSLVKDIPIKNVLNLKPYRTFSEIDQPESVFVFRMKVVDGQPVFTIHEADGAAWKQVAILRIKDYLAEQIKKTITYLGKHTIVA